MSSRTLKLQMVCCCFSFCLLFVSLHQLPPSVPHLLPLSPLFLIDFLFLQVGYTKQNIFLLFIITENMQLNLLTSYPKSKSIKKVCGYQVNEISNHLAHLKALQTRNALADLEARREVAWWAPSCRDFYNEGEVTEKAPRLLTTVWA